MRNRLFSEQRSSSNNATFALRSVHRLASDLRRGTPAFLHSNDHSAVMAAAETVGVGGLAELVACADGDPVLLVAPERAAALAGSSTGAHGRGMMVVPAATSAELSAYRLPPSFLNPQALRGLADPTIAPASTLPLQRVLEPPPLGAAALALAKLARLLPTLVVAPAGGTVGSSGLLAAQAADVLAYPVTAAATLHPAAEAAVPLDGAPDARLVAFRAADGGVEHLAVLVGRPDELARSAGGRAPLVRLHSECFTGDVLGSLRCDCGPQLRGAILRMAEEGAGVLLYLAQEGRGIGLVNKLRAYRLQDGGLDTLDANKALGWHADERSFMVAAAMLERLGVTRIRLLTNNPDKLAALAACGIRVESREAHLFAPNGVNDGYLDAKARRFGHLLT